MNEKQIERILKNAKTSMEIEGFVIDKELEETGRKILKGEINIGDYQVSRKGFNYTEWRENLLEGLTIDEVFERGKKAQGKYCVPDGIEII